MIIEKNKKLNIVDSSMKKILLFLIIGIFLISFTSAQSYQQGKNITYNQPCYNDGAFCDSSFTCNLTVQDFNGKIIVDNKQMNRTNSYYFYNIPAQVQMGIYPPTIMSCTNSTTSGRFNGEIEITADGNPYVNFPIVYVIVLVALILMILSNIKWISKQFETNILGIFSGISFIVSGIIVFSGFNYTNYSTLLGLTSSLILIGLGVLILSKELEEYI